MVRAGVHLEASCVPAVESTVQGGVQCRSRRQLSGNGMCAFMPAWAGRGCSVYTRATLR